MLGISERSTLAAQITFAIESVLSLGPNATAVCELNSQA